MSRCGDCDNFRASSAMGPASGLCSAQKTGEMSYKMVTYHLDASKCKFYKELNKADVRTDTVNAPIDPKTWKPYKDFEEKKVDVKIDKSKVKDTKQWG
jgi:hypothetical protein